MQYHFQEQLLDLAHKKKIINKWIDMEKKRVHVLISGKVQGVWFRESTKQKAEQLGVFGWIRNTSDGRVEAVFEGEKNKVDEMIEWCNNGSDQARVENIEVEEQDPTDILDSFNIKH